MVSWGGGGGGGGGVHCFLVLLVSKVRYTTYDLKKNVCQNEGMVEQEGGGADDYFCIIQGRITL